MKNSMKSSTQQLFRKTIACLLAFLIVNGPVWAIDYTTDVIDSTHANFSASGNTTTVDVLANRSVINWSNFNTADGEILQFVRDGGANFAVLNRILSGEYTQFDGKLFGNQGHIIVINTNGIVFGPTAIVNAHKFTASGLNLSDIDFMEGHYQFSGGSGAIENKGLIEAQEIALIGSKILNSGTLVSGGQEGLIVLAAGNNILLTSEDSDIVIVVPYGDSQPASGVASGDIVNDTTGVIENPDGTIVLAAGDMFAQALDGLPDRTLTVNGATGNVIQRGTVNGGGVTMTADRQVRLEAGSQTTVSTAGGGTGNINIHADNVTIRESLHAESEMEVLAQKSIIATQDVSAGGNMTLGAGSNALSIGGRAESGGDMELAAGTYVSLGSDAVSGGEMSVTTGSDDTFAMGNLIAQNDLTLDTHLYLGNPDDQTIESTDGRVTGHGFIHKVEPGQLFITGGDPDLSVDLKYDGPEWGVSNRGNVYISGLGDIQLSGDINSAVDLFIFMPTDFGDYFWSVGGVSVISENGRIYTEGSDALNIFINAYSDDLWENIGVDLPFKGAEGQSLGKAAIVLKSKEDLILGSGTTLLAHGAYAAADNMALNGFGVDDRPGVNFLAEDAVIGGFDRDQGIPIDVAIYGGSTEGDVIVQTSDIAVWQYGLIAVADYDYDYPIHSSYATVVFDAYDTVSMPFLDNLSVEHEFGDFRMEVASRLCEWLSDAVDGGKLPYADNPEFVEAILGEGNYVLRGAGQNNPGSIAEGERAWVLEDLPAEPIVPPLAVLEIPELKGCPVEMDAAAIELGIPSDTLQMTIRNALAMNPNIQPCDACASLVTAATVLNDADGVRLAAMNQIFNTLAPADIPFTPEVSASVVTAFAQLGDQDRQYALAAEYIDAFVRYVAILDTELKAPVGDPIAFALEKHGDPIMSDDANPNIAAYILSQLMPEGI